MKGGGIKNNTKPSALVVDKRGKHHQRMEVLLKIDPHIPDAPAHFDERHLSKWNEVIEKVVAAGIWQKLDYDALQSYIENWVIMEDSMKLVQEQGAVLWIETPAGKKPMRNPAHLVYMEAFKVCKAFMEQFGMTPRSRQSIIVEKKDERRDPLDDL